MSTVTGGHNWERHGVKKCYAGAIPLPAPWHEGYESRGHRALTPTRGPGESPLHEPSKCIRKRMHTGSRTGNKYCLCKITKSCLSRIGTIHGARGLMGYAYMSVMPRPNLRKERRLPPPGSTHDLSKRTDARTLVNNGDVSNEESVLTKAHSASCPLLWRKHGWPILVCGSTAPQGQIEHGCCPTNNRTRNCTSLKIFLTHFCAKSMIPPPHALRPRQRAHAWLGGAAEGQGPPA